MIRTCFLLLCLIKCFGNVSAQENPEKSLIVEWALQQQLVLNEQTGKTLRLGISNGNADYVVYTYEKLNDSVYREKVEESNMGITGGQLYLKRGNQLIACYPIKDRYTDRDFSGYRDSSNYLVRDTIMTKRGELPFHRRDVVHLDSNYNVAEWWTYVDGKDSISYHRELNLDKNCSERYEYYLTKTDSIKYSYWKSCWGDAVVLLPDEKVLVSYWERNTKRNVLFDEWIVPAGLKRSFNLIDFAAEPTMIGGKLIRDDEVRIRTDKKGIIKRITINSFSKTHTATVGFNWQ